MKTVIFDLDGTLADIEIRRAMSTLPNGKMNWSSFFDETNIQFDVPNVPVIETAQALSKAGHPIVIFSGRSQATEVATRQWLKKYDVPFDGLKMRPAGGKFQFTPDDKLKKMWLDDQFKDPSEILCVFDDRAKVVQMWRENGIPCFQVAPGDF